MPMQTSFVIEILINLMQTPDADKYCVADVAHVYNTNRQLFDETASKWTDLYAKWPFDSSITYLNN